MSILGVRRAKSEDAEQIARIQIQTWRSTFVGIVSDEYLASLSLEKVTQRIFELINNPLPNSTVIVAIDESDSAIGFSLCGPNRLTESNYDGEVQAFFVLPEWQGKGVGKRLMNESLRYLRTSGFREVIIWTFEANLSARTFYSARGGKLVERRVREIAGSQLAEVGFGYSLIKESLEAMNL
jgi:GNAT superfamily N-acetyltransferase